MPTPDQLTFADFAGQPTTAPPSLSPAAGREQPSVWVAKLAVFHDWPPGPETLLREIELHRGLNILWAKPTGSTEPAARLAGHGAGKTTFCRLLRYVLDEETAGNPVSREAFTAKYRNGWVLGEVFLCGEQWLVGRPLPGRVGAQSFAKAGASIADDPPKQPSRSGYEEYRAALDTAVFGKMTLRTLAASRDKLDWRHLLPWLSRDQEAHYSGLLEWRHEESDSRAPKLSAEDKANLVRLMLGLVEDEEQKLLTEFAKKAQAHEQKVRDRPKMEFAVERERRALEGVLGMKVENPDAPLLQREVDKKVAGLRTATDLALASTKQSDDENRLSDVVSRHRIEWGLANAWAEELEDMVQLEESRARGITPPPPRTRPEDPYRRFVSGMGPFPGYCSHPMNKAWREGCPIAHERQNDEEVPRATAQIIAEAKPAAARLAEMKVELARRQQQAAPKKTALGEAEKALRDARARRQSELEKLKEPGKEAARIEAMLTSYRNAGSEMEAWDAALSKLKDEKDELDTKLAALTERHETLIRTFGGLFNHIAHHMLGSEITGSVRFSGKSIVPELDYHGPRDSAALKVTKWLAFDLAALALGVTTVEAHHPRILIHDSPREADLAAPIYRALFTAARLLENGAPVGAAPFQYIVTTTEPPPEELNRKPWKLEPELDASDPTKRFLGVDLG